MSIEINSGERDSKYTRPPVHSRTGSLVFDAHGYEPLEWEDLFNSIAVALKGADLPSLYEDEWRMEGDGFLFVGTDDQVEQVREVLEQFAVRIFFSQERDRAE